MPPRRTHRCEGSGRPGLWASLLAAVVLAITAPVAADEADSVDDVFGGFGSSTVVDEEESAAYAQGEGGVAGRVLDGVSAEPVSGVTVILIWPDDGSGGESRQEVQVTEGDGGFEFASIPPGTYTLSFIKSGYRASNMTGFEIVADQVNTADFPLPPLEIQASGEVLELDAYVVEAAVVGDMMSTLELRMDSDQLLNIMSAEDLSRFAASDVGDALKRVAGVNVVEGQFAIIRGLEDRYSSTLVNGAVVPSPDPDRQSLQLDLFPNEVVGGLVVSKSFAPDLPSNSSGGSIDIVTADYPDGFQFQIKGSTGFNSEALGTFIEHDDANPIGRNRDGWNVLESEFATSLGGTQSWRGREFRFKGVFQLEEDFETLDGFQEGREPRAANIRPGRRGRPDIVRESGDLSLGQLSLSRGLFDLTTSTRNRRFTGFAGAGMSLDPNGAHQLDGSFLFTDNKEEIVEFRDDGFMSNVDYGPILESARNGDVFDRNLTSAVRAVQTVDSPIGSREEDRPEDGPLFYSPISDSRSFKRKRDLWVFQANGQHVLDFLDGATIDWASNYAKTTQSETALAARYFYEPDDPQGQIPDAIPTSPAEIGPGQYVIDNSISYNANDITERQYFTRVDFEYVRPITENIEGTIRTGGWYEDVNRDVEAEFLATPRLEGDSGNDFAILGDSPREAGAQIPNGLGLFDDNSRSDIIDSDNESVREIQAWHASGKLSFFETVDFHGGFRLEDIRIESKNDAFTGVFDDDGGPLIFPSRYLTFDRFDNPNLIFESRIDTDGNGVLDEQELARVEAAGFNSDILGIDVPVNPDTGFVDFLSLEQLDPLINGEIDELKVLPSAGITWRPDFLHGMTLRAGYSETVARPSFRELGYYVTTEPGTDDVTVGNPQLGLSDVQSWDLRVEYVIGDLGDLMAFSFFSKEIEDPIEAIAIRDPATAGNTAAVFRTFLNNPSTADLLGIEVEARFNLDFFGLTGPLAKYLQYFSIGGNFTWIDAEVERSETELERAAEYFGVADGDVERIGSFDDKRRLFNQPEWIGNGDLSFDHPGWGTRITLAVFAISDVLDAAGTAGLNSAGERIAFTLDRYTDDFHQLDLIIRQEFELPRQLGGLQLKADFKNLTNTRRGIFYDRSQLSGKVYERRFKSGIDYTFSMTWTYEY